MMDLPTSQYGSVAMGGGAALGFWGEWGVIWGIIWYNANSAVDVDDLWQELGSQESAIIAAYQIIHPNIIQYRKDAERLIKAFLTYG